ncbi:hypothetical protein GCM10023321_24730 [Pseudonocardia eucalypti]|uniref:HTH tetR-type domain-containing protein n=2 Tax=Pseudonocardia eucalypti TaxID=648755 RepID=A0ABP9PY60_9PSEU
MNMDVRHRTVPSRPSLLQTATEVLVADPGASLADVARAAGIGRTTLHKLYPTRHALLLALAEDALDQLERTYREVGLDAPGHEFPSVLGRLVTALLPLGARMEFLFRERSLDAEAGLMARLDVLDAPVRELVGRAVSAGVLRADLPADWVVAALNSLVYSAWEQVSLGRLAPVAAPGMVLTTLLDGAGARDG